MKCEASAGKLVLTTLALSLKTTTTLVVPRFRRSSNHVWKALVEIYRSSMHAEARCKRNYNDDCYECLLRKKLKKLKEQAIEHSTCN